MRQVVDPKQQMMFDPFGGVISAAGWTRISNGWQGIFREVVWELLPGGRLARHFDRWQGS
ncbi:MAG: hypothetical protein ACKV2Q_15600 [Planctomycetaceae bacterium]